MFRKILSLLLAAMFIISIPAAKVSAESKAVNVQLTNGEFVYEHPAGESVISFKLNHDVYARIKVSDKKTDYTIHVLATDIKMSSISYYQQTRDKFLLAGEYEIIIKADVAGTITFSTNPGTFTLTENGKTEQVYLTRYSASYRVGLWGDGEGTLSFSLYDDVKSDDIYWTKNSKSYKGNSIAVTAGDSVILNVKINGKIKEYYFHIYKVGELKYTHDRLQILLVESGGSIEYKSEFTPEDQITQLGCGISDKTDSYVVYDIKNEKKVKIDNITVPKHITEKVNSQNGEEQRLYTYVLLKDKSGSNTLTLDKTIDLRYSFSHDQKVYAYTPDKDGIYTVTSTQNDTISNLVLAVFDQSDKMLGVYDSNINQFDQNMNEDKYEYLRQTGKIDHSLNLSVELKAGQTYYFYFYSGYQQYYKINVSYKPAPQKDPTPSPSNDEMSFEDFVERLYVVALNRPSEKDGKDYWCELVGNGTLTGADCARFFLTSPEFKGRGLSDEEFLKVLYKTFFDRDAANDPDGFNFWMNSLKSVGKDTVVEGFINSPEWCDICATYGVKSGAPTAKATKASKNATAFATRLYTECLGREPEEGGLKYWSLGLTNQELTGSQAAHEFFYCKEFNDHGYDNKELITRMYKTFMGREPDTDGLNYWLNNMNNGMTKDQVFNSFVQSQEFTEICASYAITR